MSEYTPERLMEWAADCNRRNDGDSGMRLVEYANAWERERDGLRAEVSRLRQALCDEATAIAQGAGQYGQEWITHDSDHAPADLAPDQIVHAEWDDVPGRPEAVATDRADYIPWVPGLRYRPALSACGLPLCSAESLEPGTTHVTNDEEGAVQWTAKPWICTDNPHATWQDSNSLMEVWRG